MQILLGKKQRKKARGNIGGGTLIVSAGTLKQKWRGGHDECILKEEGFSL